MKKLFFVFFIMFLTFGSLGNIESSSNQNHSISNAEASTYYSESRFEKRYYWNENLKPIELESEENQKQIMCMAKNIFFEAATESTAGKLAVAQVVFNRVNSQKFPNTICEVVYEGLHYTGHNGARFPVRDRCQFSWYCDGRGDEPRESRLWTESQKLAKHIFHYRDKYIDITDGATHYHADYIDDPRWARADKRTASIDQHRFYRLTY